MFLRDVCVDDTQLAEQLAEVPTILYFLKQRIPEQIVDNPVPHGGRGASGGLQGFLPGHSSLKRAANKVDIPQMVEQLVDFLSPLDFRIAEHVIEVPNIVCPPRAARTVLRAPQTVEQLAEVPAPVSYSSLLQRTTEQHVEIPVPLQNTFLSGLSSRTLTFLLLVEAFTTFAQARVHPQLHALQLIGSTLRMRRFKGFFRTFPQNKKSATQPPHSGSAPPPHSSPWTPAAYDASMVLEDEEEEEEEKPEDEPVEFVEYVQHDGRWWECEWDPARQRYCWWLAAADGSQVGHTIWRPPWLIGRGPG